MDISGLREAIGAKYDEIGQVALAKKIGITPVSLRSFYQGGDLYAKTLVKLATFCGMKSLAKEIAADAAEAAAKKNPGRRKKKSTGAVKTKAKTKSKKMTVSLKAAKPLKKKKKKIAAAPEPEPEDNEPKEPISALAGGGSSIEAAE